MQMRKAQNCAAKCNDRSRSRTQASALRRGLAASKTLEASCVLDQPDGWARGEREGYGGPRDVNSLSLKKFEEASASLPGSRDALEREFQKKHRG